MNNCEKLDLYPHNIESSQKALSTLKNGQRIVAIIQATGTGKTYNGLELSLEFKGEKILWVTPANAINEHIEKIINDNPNLSLKEDFPNLQIRTYQSFVNLTREELENIECDFLIIDEIQHLTAPVWGERMRTIVKTHPNMKVLGLTAYTTNYRGTIYERDVTAPETDEIFSDAVVSEYDLYDAIIDGILPKPIVKSVITEESEIIIEIKEKIEILKNKGDKTYLEYQKILDDIIRMIHTQNGVKKIIQQTVKPGGKYIYYCPINSEEGKNDIDSIMDTMMDYLKEKHPNQKIVFYKTTSADGKIGKYNRECFYNDVDLDGDDVKDCIRIIFAINQYNLGVHAPNVDGVFLGRRTRSDIVAFEQIGRALSVRGDASKKIEEYTKYSLEELLQIAANRGIQREENTSKEQIIELLVAPIIIDLADNIEFLEELETNLGDRVKEIREQGPENKRIIKITDTRIDISVINKDLLLVLQKVRENLRNKTWNDTYNLLVAYYNKYGNTEVPQKFITMDGVTEIEATKEGTIQLGNWCTKQRFHQDKLSNDKIKKLESIGFRFVNLVDLEWAKKYNLAKKFYDKYGHSEIPNGFITIDGITEVEVTEEGAVKLGNWCTTQRSMQKKLSNKRRKKLEQIGFRFDKLDDLEWEKKYNLAKKFYDKYGHSKIPNEFITIDGITEVEVTEEEAVKLGVWCDIQRQRQDTLSPERRRKLELIDFRFDKLRNLKWEKNYDLLKNYHNEYGHSNVPQNFITVNGITEVEATEEGAVRLGNWCDRQRQRQNTLSPERKKKLELIDFNFGNPDDLVWEKKYNLAKNYYDEYGNSEIPFKFKTVDGITKAKEDEKGVIALGAWCLTQRHNQDISSERRRKLELIGFRFITRKDYKTKIIELCDKYNLDYKKNKFLMKMPYQELYAKIEYLMDNNLTLQIDGKINPIFSMSNVNMQMQYGISKEELITKYYLNKGKGV